FDVAKTALERCCTRDGGGPRSRSAGGGCKPPQAAPVKSRGGERCGNGAPGARQVRVAKASGSEPLMTCRNSLDDIETGVEKLLRDEPGGSLPTGQVVSGMKVARARLRRLCGHGNLSPRHAGWSVWPSAGRGRSPSSRPARGCVPMRGTGADRLVVATMPGNAGGAKGAGHLGSLGGQPAPIVAGRSQGSEPKPFAISKWVVWEAYRRVKANQGAAGVDEVSMAE